MRDHEGTIQITKIEVNKYKIKCSFLLVIEENNNIWIPWWKKYYNEELEVLRLYKNMKKCLYVKWQKTTWQYKFGQN